MDNIHLHHTCIIQILSKADRNLQQCKQIIARIELETRDMQPDDRQTVRQVLRARGTKVKELKNEYKWIKSELEARIQQKGNAHDDEEEVDGTAVKSNKKDKENNPPSQDGMEKYAHHQSVDEMGHTVEEKENALMDYGRKIQEEDMNILDRVIIDVDQAKQTATETAQKVNEQTAQIQRIHDTLGEVDSELDRAKRIMTRISRRMLTDKILWFFLSLIFISILLIVLTETGVIKKGVDNATSQTERELGNR